MKFGKWVLAGSAGGLAGALVWAAISYGANAEVGYLAWAIGAIVGFCVRVAAGGDDEGTAPGLTAVGVAIGAIVLGKYLAVSFTVSKIANEIALPPITETHLICQWADEIIEERQAKGQTVVMPNGISVQDATEQAHYPPDIWHQASAKWQLIPVAERTQKLDQETKARAAAFAALKGAIRSQGFFASFGVFDVLWFLLAAGTAYKLGSGNSSDDD
jgi:hypothetical protein